MSIGNVFKAKIPVTALHGSHYCTCLGHLGQHDRYRIISFFVALPKVAKGSTITCCHMPVTVACVITLTFADGNKALCNNIY